MRKKIYTVDNIIKNDPIFSIEPSNHDLEEWKTFVNRLKEKVLKISLDEKKRIGKLREIRKDLTRKDKALGFYKKEIKELNQVIEEYETNLFYLIKRLLNKYYLKLRQKFCFFNKRLN